MNAHSNISSGSRLECDCDDCAGGTIRRSRWSLPVIILGSLAGWGVVAGVVWLALIMVRA